MSFLQRQGYRSLGSAGLRAKEGQDGRQLLGELALKSRQTHLAWCRNVLRTDQGVPETTRAGACGSPAASEVLGSPLPSRADVASKRPSCPLGLMTFYGLNV